MCQNDLIPKSSICRNYCKLEIFEVGDHLFASLHPQFYSSNSKPLYLRAFQKFDGLDNLLFLTHSELVKTITRQMNKHYLTLFFTGTAALMLAACGGETKDESSTETKDTAEVVEPTSTQMGFGSQGTQTYAVPSPNELFSIIKESKLPYKDGLISTSAVNYSSSKNQALNFGRLTADIAYTASYEKFQESMANFDNLRKVGSDLGISYVFDEFMVNRVKNNMDNADSLEVISSSSYQNIIGMLEENEKGSTLAIIAAGGFVESIYILTNLIGEHSAGSEVIQRLADEKLVLENLLDYLNQYAEEERVVEVIDELTPVAQVFLNLKEETFDAQKKSEDGKVVIGGSRVVMSKAEFDALKAAATAYRNSFANASQS